MKNYLRYLLIGWISFFLFGTDSVLAEGEVVYLQDALKRAYANNPTLQVEREKVEAARGRWFSAKKLPAPEVELELGGLKGGNAGLDSYSVSQPLDNLPGLVLEAKAAKNEFAASQASLKRTWSLVARDVKVIYAQILVAQKELEVARSNLNATLQFLSLVETRFQTGNALRSDLLRSKIELSRAQSELLRDEKRVKLSKARLNLLMAEDVLLPIEVSGELNLEFLNKNLDELFKKASISREDLKERELLREASRKRVQSEKFKTFLPALEVGVERVQEDFEDDVAIGFKFSYPLWDLNQGALKEAKAKFRQNKVELASVQKQVRFEVFEGFLEVELAEQQLRLQKKALEESNELLRQSLIQYQEGEIGFLKYLESLSAVRETRLNYYRTLALAYEQIANLELAVELDNPVEEVTK